MHDTRRRIPLAYRTENGQKGIIVARFEKHFLPVISPGHDVKEKTWRVDTGVTRHEGKVAPARSRVEDWRGISQVLPICYRPFRLTVPH